MDPTTTALAEAFINTSSDCFTDRYGLHRFQAPLKCERTKSYIKRAVGMPCAIWMAEIDTAQAFEDLLRERASER